MCTSICFRNNNNLYFGRNLDVEFSFKEQVVITPKNHKINLRNGDTITLKYPIIGMASVIANTPLYYEGSNSYGLSMAGLNFPGNACYNKPLDNKLNLCLFEFIPYCLGLYKSVKELKEVLVNLNLVDTPFSETLPNSPLHFMISDFEETIVLEQTKEGVKIYSNPYDIMTNNPPFPYHLYNIANYRNINPKNGENLFNNNIELDEYCVGMGSVGLPGDSSSPSRFVKGAFILKNLPKEDNNISDITNFFHTLDSVKMIKGSTLTKQNKFDITLYSCCFDALNKTYYYKLYNNSRLNAVKLTSDLESKDTITCFDLQKNQDINYQN